MPYGIGVRWLTKGKCVANVSTDRKLFRNGTARNDQFIIVNNVTVIDCYSFGIGVDFFYTRLRLKPNFVGFVPFLNVSPRGDKIWVKTGNLLFFFNDIYICSSRRARTTSSPYVETLRRRS